LEGEAYGFYFGPRNLLSSPLAAYRPWLCNTLTLLDF